MPSHEQFNLNPRWHYMCWECYRKKFPAQTAKAAVQNDPVLDHCCWCGELHKSGMYWGGGSSTPGERICNDAGLCHPRFETGRGFSTNRRGVFTYAERPKEEE